MKPYDWATEFALPLVPVADDAEPAGGSSSLPSAGDGEDWCNPYGIVRGGLWVVTP